MRADKVALQDCWLFFCFLRFRLHSLVLKALKNLHLTMSHACNSIFFDRWSDDLPFGLRFPTKYRAVEVRQHGYVPLRDHPFGAPWPTMGPGDLSSDFRLQSWRKCYSSGSIPVGNRDAEYQLRELPALNVLATYRRLDKQIRKSGLLRCQSF